MKGVYLLFLFLPLFVFGQDNSPILVDDCLQMKGLVKRNCKIFAEPKSDSYDVSIAERFTILYIFSHNDIEVALKNDFYRVGKSPNIAIGYVHKNDILEWNHRVCLRFTSSGENRDPALVYPTIDAAKEQDWDEFKNPNNKAIAKEPISASDINYDMLFPILKEITVTNKGDIRESMKAYKIGQLSEIGRSQVNPIVDNPKYKSKLDLMILINASSSMQNEIKDLANILNNLKKEVERSNCEIRIGISSFHAVDKEVIYKNWQPLTSDIEKVIENISNIISSNYISDDANSGEGMYNGALEAIKSTNWSRDKEYPILREILVISDTADLIDHKNRELVTEEVIIKASKERIRFLTLNVGGSEKLGNQLAELADGFNDGDSGLYMETRDYLGSTPDDYIKKLSLGIKGEIERLQELGNVRSGVKRLEDVVPSNRIAPIDSIRFSSFTDSGLYFNEGWITEKNEEGIRQVEPYVYMTYGDLAKYKFFCQAAIATALAEDMNEAFIDLTTDKLTAMSGEVYDRETELGEHLRKALCLPSSERGILKYSLSEIFRWSQVRKRKFISSIAEKVKILDQIIRENANWRNPIGTDLKYTLVDMDLMP